MSKIVCEIKGVIFLGGGRTYHAEYDIAVTYNEEEWSVLRRFREFNNLYQHLATRAGGGEALAMKGITFPEKSMFGSYLSTDSGTIENRKRDLQKFLTGVFETNEFSEDLEVLNFIDSKNKGVSGINRDLGPQRIVKETFCDVLISGKLPGLIWSRCYVALTVDGYLYVMQSKYEESHESLASWCLTTPGVTVTAKGPAIQIAASTHPLKLKLAFKSGPDTTFWIRTMSDFAMSSISTARTTSASS